MASSMTGKVALVTGGGSGIGRATALAFSKEGANVAIADIDAEGGDETVRMIEDEGGKAIFVKTDVSKSSEVEALVKRVIEVYGRLDYAHNNAAVDQPFGPTHEFPEDLWDDMIAVNLKGVWLCMKYEISRMLEQGGGAIVNTSSIMGLVGGANDSGYAASKFGVVGLTKTAAIEYARSGIRVNAICPGPTRTPLLERGFATGVETEEQFITALPIGRIADPKEQADAVVWLCSNAASFVTGHIMSVDGGYVTQ